MIEYPDDAATEAEAKKHGIPEDVLIRDLVRIVEVLHLDAQGFFDSKRVLAGSMALRCFNSPRFTVYDADFATAVETKPGRKEMLEMLRYSDDDLEIRPTNLTPHDVKGTAWKSEPINYLPAFTSLADEKSRQFKADISSRGLLFPDGVQKELLVPYDLGIWSEAPIVRIMDPHEVVAEKVLGWVVHREAKHYADLAFIAVGTRAEAGPIFNLDRDLLRETLDGKLQIMKGVQPTNYAPWATIEDVVNSLAEDPIFSVEDWTKIVYVRAHRDRFTKGLVRQAVQALLVPMLR